MIESFGSPATRSVFDGSGNPFGSDLPERIARRKLDMLNAAHDLRDLRVPPGNRLEMLKGDLKGWFSIRINQRWRIIFRWETPNASQVKIVDYH